MRAATLESFSNVMHDFREFPHLEIFPVFVEYLDETAHVSTLEHGTEVNKHVY